LLRLYPIETKAGPAVAEPKPAGKAVRQQGEVREEREDGRTTAKNVPQLNQLKRLPQSLQKKMTNNELSIKKPYKILRGMICKLTI